MRKLVIPVVAALVVALAATPAQAVDDVNTKKLRDAVTVGGILSHERVFQRIANQNGGNRASGLPGYAASAAYVKQVLKQAGYKVKEQTFDFPFFQETAPATAVAGLADADDLRDRYVHVLRFRHVTGQVVRDQRHPGPAAADTGIDLRLRGQRLRPGARGGRRSR